MKKIYTIVSAIALAGVINAQTTIDFELFSLSGGETYDNGSAQTGDWDFGGTTLANVYDTAWGGSWTGFSVSNTTDILTPGFGNQYSSWTGSGFIGSSKYTVHHLFGNINTNNWQVKIDSFKITNTSYSALSMRDGDMFGKQFGSFNDANGVPDGTNGEDFFSIWIYAENFDGSLVDSVEFFLADYRFADSAQDYILDSWVNIDLTGFSFPVARLDFAYASSDVGMFGLNTPLYFALDNLVTSTVADVQEVAVMTINAFPNPMTNKLFISEGLGVLTLTDAAGKPLIQEEHIHLSVLDVSGLSSGVFFITLQNENGKITQRLIK